MRRGKKEHRGQDKFINAKPDYAEAYNNLGVILQAQERLEEAIEACKQAINIKPDYAEAYNSLGNSFKEQGKLDRFTIDVLQQGTLNQTWSC